MIDDPRLIGQLSRVAPLALHPEPHLTVIPEPKVPMAQRNCSSCRVPVGRATGERAGRDQGTCTACGHPYSFVPALHSGELVGGQYEILGCLAHGGQGWIYLAADRNLPDHFVVLKGLLSIQDDTALKIALAERKFLTQMHHPSIVKIYTFVTHRNAGYIVMEYLGGISLATLLRQLEEDPLRESRPGLDAVVDFGLALLPALQHIHDLGLVYCDVKPANLMQVGAELKLIDLEAVQRINDRNARPYGTLGFEAPEISKEGASIASDIYSVGRTLLALALPLRGFFTTYRYSLPPLEETALFRRHDSFYRILARACALDPRDRFASVTELHRQLQGVFREVIQADRPVTAELPYAPRSTLFNPPATTGSTLTWNQLPTLREVTDPMLNWHLEVAQAALSDGDLDRVDQFLQQIRQHAPEQWQATWVQGLRELKAGDDPAALRSFTDVYRRLPGELAPKLAQGLAAERCREFTTAIDRYTVCATTDVTYRTAAAFGLARVHADHPTPHRAVAALDLIPSTSSAWPLARLHRAWLLGGPQADLQSLSESLASIQGVAIDHDQGFELRITVLQRALDLVLESGPVPDLWIGGCPAMESGLRDGLERAYRESARFAPPHSNRRYQLVDAANAVRGWSLR
jgi:serine/threonine-protein kinase PknG